MIELIAARAGYSWRSTRTSRFADWGFPISGNAHICHTLLCLLGDFSFVVKWDSCVAVYEVWFVGGNQLSWESWAYRFQMSVSY